MTNSSSIHGITVLVVDDSTTIRRSAQIFLESSGCNVITSDNGFDALGMVVDNKPDIILCDLIMPRLDGYQFCTLLKKSQYLCKIPVIFLSSKDGLFDKVRGVLVGCEDYLIKPFSKSSLLSMVALYSNRE
jgi:twitching motility two-component system response regulator PilG